MSGSNSETLEQIEKLLALNLTQGKDQYESIKLLYRADYNSKDIEKFTGIPASTVRTRVSELREEGEIE